MPVRSGIALFIAIVAAGCGQSIPDDSAEAGVPVEGLAYDSAEGTAGEGAADQVAGGDTAGGDTGTGNETDGGAAEDAAVTIGVVNLTSIAALDLLYEGFEEGVADCSTSDAVIDYRNVNGDGSLLRPQVDELLADEADLILAITTPALQAAAAANQDDGGETPILFGAVTDPYTAGVAVDETDKPEWLTGWRTNADVEPLFELAAEIRDPLTTIGVVYNPDQVNSTIDVGKMQAVADGLGLDLVIAEVPDRDAVEGAADDLVAEGVEIFFVPNDIVVVDGLDAMAAIADEHDIPIVSLAPDSVYDGAAVGIGLDYRGDGGRLAEDACRILAGSTTAAELPIRSQREQLVFYSPAAADEQGFTIPGHLIGSGFDIDGPADSAPAGE